ncbi:hypothetical protein U9M48_029688 [Paspalum notatum var. saurae]|uniref:Transcription elongation factor 1 homolog n=1 Tax=Paspalum notatum var. saurae TaxID=547442 RepID=A0AAQ3X1U8_PASNO
MARKKSRRSKPAPKKVQKLETCFDCPFCGHPGTVVDLKNRIAEATCGTCKESCATAANALTCWAPTALELSSTAPCSGFFAMIASMLCVVPARFARSHNPQPRPTAGDIPATTPTNTDRTP